jgi:phage shock protein PspC (stress-responsive transcriptional regulator)
VRRLHRSKQRRVIAGVAGGLGEYAGVDPVLFRVLFAVLTVFGGAGILLYVLAWLFLPDEDQPTSPAESLIGRGTGGTGSRAGDAVQAVGLAVAALVLGALLIHGDPGDVVLVIVLVIGGVLLARHLDDRRRDGPPPAPDVPPAPPPAYQPYQAYDYPSGPGVTATATVPPVTVPPVTYGPPAPRPPRERSILGLLTISLLLVVLGVAAAVDAASGGDALQPRHYLALAVGVIGLGLIVGAFRGRARGLIWIGIPLTIALAAVSTADLTLQGGTGDRQYRPVAISDVAGEYQLGIGSVRLDLTGLDFAEQDVSTRVHAGLGDITVTVPRDVDVRVTGRAGIGEVDLFGQRVNGTSNERAVVDEGPDGPGGGDLGLVLGVGVGQVEVDRATA